MRWTDLPPDSGPADGRAAALRRGEWEELRRRLEQLPDGHPSRPEDGPEAMADEGLTDEALTDEALADRDLADRDLADEGSASPGSADPWDAEPAAPLRRVRGPGSADARHAKPGGLGDAGGRGERERYRPWFTGGDWPEPWFAAEPD